MLYFIETVERESEHKATASCFPCCSISTEIGDDIMDAGISRDLKVHKWQTKGSQEFNDIITNTDHLIEDSTKAVRRTVQVESINLADNVIPTETDGSLTSEDMSGDVDRTDWLESQTVC